MRQHLLDTFRDGRDDGYTYQELIALRTAGKEIPVHWIARAKHAEDQAARSAAMSAAITSDLQAAEDARQAAREAVKAYHAAHREAGGKFGTIIRTVKAEYGEPVKDGDGNPAAGQTHVSNLDRSVVLGDGRRVDRPELAAEFDTREFRGL